MKKLPDIRKADIKGKTVFLRADLDVPLLDGEIEDDTRLLAGLPTAQYLLENGAKVIIAGHLGRPKGLDESLSLRPVAEWLFKNLQFTINNLQFQKTRIGDFDGWEITPQLFLLENLRFYEGEETNDPEFAKKLASAADIYVNDAFAMSHRSHASVVGVAKLLPHYAGLRLQKEVEELSHVLENPEKPLVVIIGGQKIETKLPLVSKMVEIADCVLVGGKIAQENDLLLKDRQGKITAGRLLIAGSNKEGTDISGEGLGKFLQVIKSAKTIIWNGPMGKIEAGPAARQPQNLPTALASAGPHSGAPRLTSPASELVKDTERGTEEVAKAIVESGAYSVIGGGDTTEFLKKIGLYDKFHFVSTGGGAMLSFLSGEKLPGLEALK